MKAIFIFIQLIIINLVHSKINLIVVAVAVRQAFLICSSAKANVGVNLIFSDERERLEGSADM